MRSKKRPRARRASAKRGMRIVVEKNGDGYVAYPVGFEGVVVGEGDTQEEALADVKSTIAFHIQATQKVKDRHAGLSLKELEATIDGAIVEVRTGRP